MSATVSVIFAVAMLVLLVWAIMKKTAARHGTLGHRHHCPDYCGRCKSRGVLPKHPAAALSWTPLNILKNVWEASLPEPRF